MTVNTFAVRPKSFVHTFASPGKARQVREVQVIVKVSKPSLATLDKEETK